MVRILFAVHAGLVVNDGAGNQRSVDLGSAVGVAVVVVGKAAQVTVGGAGLHAPEIEGNPVLAVLVDRQLRLVVDSHVGHRLVGAVHLVHVDGDAVRAGRQVREVERAFRRFIGGGFERVHSIGQRFQCVSYIGLRGVSVAVNLIGLRDGSL